MGFQIAVVWFLHKVRQASMKRIWAAGGALARLILVFSWHLSGLTQRKVPGARPLPRASHLHYSTEIKSLSMHRTGRG